MRSRSERTRGARIRSRRTGGAQAAPADASGSEEDSDANFNGGGGAEAEADSAEDGAYEPQSNGSRRRHRDPEESEARARDAEPRSDSVESFSDETAVREANETVFRLVRAILARDSGHRYVRRELLLEASKGTRLSTVLPRAEALLADVYGVALVPVDADKKTAPFVVTNCMSEREKTVLHALWGSCYTVDNRRDPTDQMYLVPKYNKGPMPVSSEALIKNGLLVVVLALIVVNENNVSEENVRRVLAQFGVPGDVNKRVSSLNMNMDDILNELVRKEYVDRQSMNADTQQRSRRVDRSEELVSYSLGRRALVEFGPMAFFKTVQDVYGDRFNEIRDKTVVTLQRCYKVSAEQVGAWSAPEPRQGEP